jgi:hypothetical protein
VVKGGGPGRCAIHAGPGAFQGDTTANTNVMNILANGVQQPVAAWTTDWIDWDMNTVLQ